MFHQIFHFLWLVAKFTRKFVGRFFVLCRSVTLCDVVCVLLWRCVTVWCVICCRMWCGIAICDVTWLVWRYVTICDTAAFCLVTTCDIFWLMCDTLVCVTIKSSITCWCTHFSLEYRIFVQTSWWIVTNSFGKKFRKNRYRMDSFYLPIDYFFINLLDC